MEGSSALLPCKTRYPPTPTPLHTSARGEDRFRRYMESQEGQEGCHGQADDDDMPAFDSDGNDLEDSC